MISNDAIDFSTIGSEVGKDQVLTAEVMRLCHRLHRSTKSSMIAGPAACVFEGIAQALGSVLGSRSSDMLVRLLVAVAAGLSIA